MDVDSTSRLGRAADSAIRRDIRRVQVLAYRDLDDPTAGGSERYVHEVLSRWSAAGLEVALRTVEVPNAPQSVSRDGYAVSRAGGHTLGVFRATAAGALKLRRGTDAVVEVWNGLPFWTPLWWRGPQVAVLHHLHDELWRSNFPAPVAAVGSFIERRIGPRAYRGVPVATLSESSGRDLERRTPLRREQISVVPPGIDEAFHPTRQKAEEPLIVAAGRLVPAKRFDAVLAGFAELRAVTPQARLVLIGDGPERERLVTQAQQLGLADSVEFAGWVTEAELIDVYSEAWLLAAASVSEGWGMTITEAAGCGTAAVASDVIGHRDAMRYSSGHLVDTDDRLATAMIETVADADACRALGETARDNSAELTWEATAAGVLELLVADSERRR